MIIVWGKKVTRKRLGTAAEFCPICRDIRPFQISRIQMVPHLYYVPLGFGQLLGHTAACLGCGTVLDTDLNRYRSLLKVMGPSLEEMEKATFPNVREVYAPRLAIEETLRRGGEIDPRIRAQLIQEPFSILAGTAEARFRGPTIIDREGRIACLVAFLVPGLLIALGCASSSRPLKDYLFGASGIILLGGLFYSLFVFSREPHRYLHRSLLPLLAGSLRPLRPRFEEIEECLESLRSKGLKLGKKVRPERLWELLSDPAAREQDKKISPTVGAR